MLLIFETLPWLFLLTALLFGLLVGSFLNVVIYRIPVMMQRGWDEQFTDWQTENDTAPTPADAKADAPARHDATSVLSHTTVHYTVASAVDTMPGGNVAEPVTETPDAGNESDTRFNLAYPPSACPQCNHKIRAIENIPVISYLALRGRCAQCQTSISLRYPFVELLTGLLTVAVALRFGPGIEFLAATVLTWFLVALSGIDVDHQLLPDSMTLPLMWIGLTLSLFSPVGSGVLFVSPTTAIIGALAGYLSLWSVFHAFRIVTGKHGMGHGDFKLLAALGAWLGWQALPLVIIISALLGSIYGIAMIVAGQQQRGATMPFGPWLAAAGWVFMMFGSTLNAWYMSMMGLA